MTEVVLTATGLILLLILFVIIFVARHHRKVLRQRRALAELQENLNKSQNNVLNHLVDGQEQARKEIADEIHDNISSNLGVVRLYSDSLRPEELGEQAEVINLMKELIPQICEDLRALAHRVAQAGIGHLNLRQALEGIASLVESTGKMNVFVQCDITSLGNRLDLELYRISQELLHNSLKHSMARSARIDIRTEHNYIHMHYSDDGRGYNPDEHTRGFGLTSIISRVHRLNGTYEDKTDQHQGFQLILTIPVDESNQNSFG